jgi:3-oxoacyl-[acyl-carrier-protein] synthase-3
VTHSAEADRLRSTAEDLEAVGFRWHHICEPSMNSYGLARAATEQLARAGKLDEIDAIVYATCIPLNGSVGDFAEWERTRDVKHLTDFPASRLQAEFGLTDAVVLGVNQQAATSMSGSIRLAGSLLQTEESWRRVLCVAADRFPAGARYEQAYNLISDGGAACVVSRQPGGFRLLTAHQITNGGLGRATDDEMVGLYFSYMHRLLSEALARARMNPLDVDWIVAQNTNRKAWQILCRLLGVPFDKVWFPSMPDVGHVIAADTIINLSQLASSGRLRPGHRIALMAAGSGLTWQCLILEAVTS